jgi:peptide/nickel transport system substrate-binding protein
MGVLVIVALVLSGLPALGQSAPPQPAGSTAAPGACPARGGVLKFGIARDAVGLDPHLNYGVTSWSVQGNVYDTLVQYDPQGRISPALAESWTQPAPTRYVFKLRRNVTFHDGSPFTAADVLYSFQRIRDPATRAYRQRDLDTLLDSATAPDPFTVDVRLKSPSATFIDMLARPEMYIASRRWADGGGDFRKAAVGTGPFRLTNYEFGVRYILERNPTAWNSPCLDRVELYPFQDDRARVNAIKSGQVDFIEYLPWQDIEFFFRERGYKVYRGRELFNLVRLNPNRAPLNNPKVRQALNFAINRQSVSIVAFGGLAQPNEGFLIRSDSWAYNPQTSKVWKHDPERAVALLREAGLQPQDVRLTFESTPLSVHLDSAQVILQQLRSLGMQVEFRVIELPVLLQKRASGDYMMAMDGLSAPWADPDAYFVYFHSTGTQHAAAVRFKNERLDQLLEEGRQTVDRERRKAIYADVERILAQEAPWIFVLWRPQAEVGRSFVKGYERLPGVLGTATSGFFERIWIEK